MNGGAFSPTGILTAMVKSSPARSATRSRMTCKMRARRKAGAPNSSVRRL